MFLLHFSLLYSILSRATVRYQIGSVAQVYVRIHCRIRSRVDRSSYVLLYLIRQVRGLR